LERLALALAMVWAGATLDCILAGGRDEGPLV
jgi:hypothetical protein